MAAHAQVASIQKPFDLGEIAKKLAAMAGAGA